MITNNGLIININLKKDHPGPSKLLFDDPGNNLVDFV